MLHGARSYLLQDEDGQTIESHSISAGLDYPGVGPEHSWLAETGRATYRPITDAQAMDAMALLARTEGIIPAIESAHALAGAARVAAEHGRDADARWCVCPGRGDKDMDTAATLVRPRCDESPARLDEHSSGIRMSVRSGDRGRAAPKGARPWSATSRRASPTSRARSG